jgi:hypothetical protein
MKFGSMFGVQSQGEVVGSLCPGCRSAIPLEDINVAKDLALCRSCGKTWTFSAVRSAREMGDINLQEPPRWVRVETGADGTTAIRYRRLSRALIFLIPFTAMWGGFSLTGIYGTQFKHGHFDVSQSLFGLPFLIGTIVMCSAIMFLLFGRWEIKLRRGEGEVFVGVGPVGWRRRFECGPGASVSLEQSNYQVNNVPQEAIAVTQAGKRVIRFGAPMQPREVKVFIAAAMCRAMA